MKNIYLIKSDSYYMFKKEIDTICNGIIDITTFNLDDVSISDVIEDASYYGLFNDYRCIIVTNCKYFGTKYKYEEETDAILSFFKNMDENITIIFETNNLLEKKEITLKSVNLGAKIVDLTTKDKSEFINNYINENNISLEKGALDKLFINSNNNIDIVINEINKISNISKTITSDLINNYGSLYNYKIKSEKVDYEDISFKFKDAIIKRDFKKGFKLLDKLIERGDEIVSLIGLLASSYIEMYKVKEAKSLGYTSDEIANILEYKNSGRLYYIEKDANFYTLDELKDIILDLSKTDINVKSGVDPLNGFKAFLLSI